MYFPIEMWLKPYSRKPREKGKVKTWRGSPNRIEPAINWDLFLIIPGLRRWCLTENQKCILFWNSSQRIRTTCILKSLGAFISLEKCLTSTNHRLGYGPSWQCQNCFRSTLCANPLGRWPWSDIFKVHQSLSVSKNITTPSKSQSWTRRTSNPFPSFLQTSIYTSGNTKILKKYHLACLQKGAI